MRFARKILSLFFYFKLATILNLLGLSLAFTVFYIVVSQIVYEYNFDKSYPGYETIYRMEAVEENGINQYFDRPLLELIQKSSSHIVASGIRECWSDEIIFSVENNPGERYRDKTICINKGYTDVFGFEFVFGEPSVLDLDVNQVIIPLSLSRRLFALENPVGEEIQTFYTAYRIAGVYVDFPENSTLENVIYKPLGTTNSQRWGMGNYWGAVRLDDSKMKDEVDKSLKYQAGQLKVLRGETYEFRLFPFSDLYFYSQTTDDPVSGDRQKTWTLFGIACVILIIAGINFANFSIALAPVRMRSVNIQRVIGVSVLSLRWSFFMEAMVLSFAAFLISLVEIQIISHTDLNRLLVADVSLSYVSPAFYVSLGVALLTGCLSGIGPARYLVSFHPAFVLKGSFVHSSRGVKLRNGLIGFQFFVTFILLIQALFIFHQNRYMSKVPLGIDKERVLAIDFYTFFRYGSSEKERMYFLDKAKAYSGCEALFASNRLVLNKDEAYEGWLGRLNNDAFTKIGFGVLRIDPGFMKGFSIPVVEGRFPENDSEAVFNETARKKYDLKVGDRVGDLVISGFMPDLNIKSFRVKPEPFALLLDGAVKGVIYIKLQEGVNENEALAYYRKLSKETNTYAGCSIPVRMMDQVLAGLYEKEHTVQVTVSLFCGLSILIAIMGVFGLVVFESQIRKKEIGIRKINGATTKDIVILFNRIYIRIVLLSFVVALPLSLYLVNRWLSSFIHHISIDVLTYIAVLSGIWMITGATVTIQCWRMANMNPVKSIKNE